MFVLNVLFPICVGGHSFSLESQKYFSYAELKCSTLSQLDAIRFIESRPRFLLV